MTPYHLCPICLIYYYSVYRGKVKGNERMKGTKG